MQAVGMIAEFNPLHNGHVYAMQAAKRGSGADALVVVMSPNYVQRGEVAIVDKWTRTKLALQAGADLVLELPLASAIQSAREFAFGGVQQLAALGITNLAFGSEDSDLDFAGLAQKRIAAEAHPAGGIFSDYTQTYASQLAQFYATETGRKITAPNTMLGLAYADADAALHAGMHFFVIPRRGAAHDSQLVRDEFASGSAIRHALRQGQDVRTLVPASTQALLEQERRMSWADFWPLLRYRLQTATLDELRAIDQMSEGLEYRLRGGIVGAADFADFLHAVKSKRYTYARLRRLALATMLNMRSDAVAFSKANPVVHVLGFTARGQQFLHERKKTATLPIVTRVAADMLGTGGVLELEGHADSLVETITGRRQNYGRRPIMEGMGNA
ncbi:nucleotidyltransferase [Lacticaseibacillus zhaodongensis]|uniref:nucleotidyltransferase n=1 Tax=Lacticaseibacillus zhaodongensis TaxID=2668065 RepID=UPI0012D35C4C|nr:nucleotidyltransferase [Lacticaseibacillus zhaodongensis]